MAKPNADNLLSNYGLWQIKTKEDPNWIPDKSLLIELERGHKSSFKEFIDVDNEEWNEGYSE